MKFVNQALNFLVTFGLIFYFYEATSNFWMALPYIVIYTTIIIPTFINNDAKYFSKFIDYVFCLFARVFTSLFKKVEIERDAVKWGLFWGGVFYVILVFTFLGSIGSFEKCLNHNGISKISYCYSTYERRELSVNMDK
jgi:hypothetical protein